MCSLLGLPDDERRAVKDKVLRALFARHGRRTCCTSRDAHAGRATASVARGGGKRTLRARFVNQHSDRHAPGIAKSAICVQRFDDSLNSAIHTTYRSWLRSSSMHEPKDPPLKVMCRLLLSHCNFSEAKLTFERRKTQEAGQWRNEAVFQLRDRCTHRPI